MHSGTEIKMAQQPKASNSTTSTPTHANHGNAACQGQLVSRRRGRPSACKARNPESESARLHFALAKETKDGPCKLCDTLPRCLHEFSVCIQRIECVSVGVFCR